MTFLSKTLAALTAIARPATLAVATVAAVTTFGATQRAANAADALHSILSAGEIKIAVPQDFPPFGSVGTDMQPQGYDIDVAKLIAKDLKVKLKLIPVTSANRIPYLTTGKADLVISSLGKNPDREKVIDFSVAYAPFYNGVFGPADMDVSGPKQLSGKVIGVTRGAVEDLALTKIAPSDATIKRFEDNNGTISAFLSGQVDLIATGNVVAAAILAKNPPKKPEPKFLIKNSPCYVGLNKDEPALKDKINAILTAAKADGRMNAISNKWLGMDLPKDL